VTLPEALEMRRRYGDDYEVRRSGRRSLAVSPFYVCARTGRSVYWEQRARERAAALVRAA
jgi:hypothetical protein